ncbi:LLM class flavin-dependent oxidoreductase [Streptomyces sp. E2N166]|uniref:LLM class flavin-dependent oxidoreductase n=1 Tax=Streptomyces sp. E2N166 TaxID=1851909 RepID=UPI001EE8102C|nr:LLM class flavin-dependent oxidoreductase [Streptomyces sp. E2N166]
MNDPIKGTARGSAPAPLSVLDTALAGRGISAAGALSGSIALAELAERRGFTRYWVTEHHSMPGVASSSPAVLLARLTAHTTRLRLGAGGVMLPNHPPLIVAEQYGLLQALAPDRIDLGLGRAPGTDQATAAALRRGRSDNDDFPQQVNELLRFLDDDFPEEHPYRGRVYAVPGPGQDKENGIARTADRPSVWLLGSSGYSAQLAADLGRPFAFAAHFSPDHVAAALQLYRDRFTPSAVLAEPYALASFAVMAADDEHEALRQTHSYAHSMMRMLHGKSYLVPAPDEAASYPCTASEQQVLDRWTNSVLHGTPDQVTAHLNRLHEAARPDEIMIASVGHNHQALLHSTELIADAYTLPTSPVPVSAR